jgi:hypothetical protein
MGFQMLKLVLAITWVSSMNSFCKSGERGSNRDDESSISMVIIVETCYNIIVIFLSFLFCYQLTSKGKIAFTIRLLTSQDTIMMI